MSSLRLPSSSLSRHALAAAMLCAATAAWCEPAPAPITGAPEPAVQTTVIEDQGAKVEELRVRGQVQRITVTPKIAGAKPYQVLPTDVGRDSMAGGTNPGRGISGRSVWHALSF
jgi:hypothetical protein